MELFELWRIANIILAFTAAALWFFMKLLPSWGRVPRYRAMASMALLAYPICYGVAATIAQIKGVQAGIWSGIMFIPIVWTFIAAVIDDQDTRDGLR